MPSIHEPIPALYTPGHGAYPPVLAGRERERVSFVGLLRDLARKRHGPPRDFVLYGPRGVGKTALLEEVARIAAQLNAEPVPKHGEKPAAVRVVRLVPDLFDVQAWPDLWDAFAEGLADANKGFDAIRAELAAWRLAEISMHGPVFRRREDKRGVTLRTLLRRALREGPLVLCIDEAHELDAHTAHVLLNAAQALRQHEPLLVVYAGTPGLPDFLSAEARASHIERAEEIPLGRLSKAAAWEAFAAPLIERKVCIKEENEARTTIWETTQGYPYFIQLLGEACWEVLARREEPTLSPGLLRELSGKQTVFTDRKEAFYARRVSELTPLGLRQVAAVLGQVFREVEYRDMTALSKVETENVAQRSLDAVLASLSAHALERGKDLAHALAGHRLVPEEQRTLLVSRLQRMDAPTEDTESRTARWELLREATAQASLYVLEDRGFVWRTEGTRYRLGIPSLADATADRVPDVAAYGKAQAILEELLRERSAQATQAAQPAPGSGSGPTTQPDGLADPDPAP